MTTDRDSQLVQSTYTAGNQSLQEELPSLQEEKQKDAPRMLTAKHVSWILIRIAYPQAVLGVLIQFGIRISMMIMIIIVIVIVVIIILNHLHLLQRHHLHLHHLHLPHHHHLHPSD